MKVVLVINACAPGPHPQAAELHGWLRGAAAWTGEAATLLLHSGDEGQAGLLDQVPTPAVIPVRLARYQPEQVLGILESLAQRLRPDLFLFCDDCAGRELPVRLAHRLGGTSLAGVHALEPVPEGLRCTREVYGNHLEAAILLRRAPFCISLARGSAEPLPLPAGPPAILTRLDTSSLPPGDWIESAEWQPDPPPAGLAQARLLLAAGRGAGSRERTALLAGIASELGAEFGVSRPVAMNAWAGLDRLVGVSGAMTRPDLCIVAGASGSAAFMAGIDKSRFILAINQDPKAPVLRCCDLGGVGDCVAILEELARLARARRGAP
jgi:electron transfer flavoprotein alpha subunit